MTDREKETFEEIKQRSNLSNLREYKLMPRKSPSEIGHAPLRSQFEPILRTMSNHCFGCGRANPHGMGLVFYREGPPDRAVCRFKLSRRYEGPPRHAHGGVIATLLDEAMGKCNKLADVVAMTRTMEVDYLRLVPLRTSLLVRAWSTKRQGRKHWVAGEITTEDGQVLARGHGFFLGVDREFALKALKLDLKTPTHNPGKKSRKK
jgi:acyl-coenzyme A thioesterase PaaI-like protein